MDKLLPNQALTTDNLRNKLNMIWQKIGRKSFVEFGFQTLILHFNIKHLHGPTEINYALNELIVICLVRNGELYVKSFMEHYLALGIKHFVFLDNVSTDHTVEILSTYKNTTILQSDLPHKIYESTMRRYLATRFSKNRWNLCSDIDELFDYPYSDQVTISNFLEYLNQNHYDAVIVQMLDMFSNIPLSQLESNASDSLKEKYPYYDISNIEKKNYWWAKPDNSRIQMHLGGIRKTLFGTQNALTKAALVKMNRRTKTFIDWHHVRNARLADISCLLLHYPFLASFYMKVQDAVQTKRYGHPSSPLAAAEYEAYFKELQHNPSLSFVSDSTQYFATSAQLIEEDFLVVSDRYKDWVKNH
jgi:hypothetical protein